jgi:MFS family permease
VTITGLAMHFVVIGFAPVLFVDRDISLTLVSLLLAAGRLGSIPGRVLSGVLYDRYGGMWVARMLMLTVVALGIPMLLIPGAGGLFLFVPFVAISASVFPIANTLLVAALPPRSAWGIGTFRSVMLGASALLSGAVSLLLHHVSVPAVDARSARRAGAGCARDPPRDGGGSGVRTLRTARSAGRKWRCGRAAGLEPAARRLWRRRRGWLSAPST